MKFDKRKVLAAAAAGVLLVGTMSTVVMAGGKGDHSRLWCRDTVCREHGADCSYPETCAGTDCQKREDCEHGAGCQNPGNCVYGTSGQSRDTVINGTAQPVRIRKSVSTAPTARSMKPAGTARPVRIRKIL